MEKAFSISTESEFQQWLVLLLESERQRMQSERVADQFAKVEQPLLKQIRGDSE
jgi:hypothetical protein